MLQLPTRSPRAYTLLPYPQLIRSQSVRTGRQGHLHRFQSIGGGIVSDRLASRFAKCRAEGRAALVIFVTGGDPTPNDMAVVLDALVEGGAELIELGMPLSAPIADGPAIQAANLPRLAAGTQQADRRQKNGRSSCREK